MTPSSDAQVSSLERLVMPGPVVAAHADIEATCQSCHVLFSRELQSSLCLDCHEEIAADRQQSAGFHGSSADAAARECAQCHTDHEGRAADILRFDRERFDHALTRFPLFGKHLEVACESCHVPQQTFHAAETNCRACHAQDDPHRGNLGEACADCHSETAWLNVRFDHDAVTGYPLTGAHGELMCTSCHVDQHYTNTPDTCIGCHAEDDPHLGNNGSQCQDCHTTRNWEEPLFDHFARTGFALAGGHSGLMCESCHEGNKLTRETPTECHACHREDDTHEGVNGTTCHDCHRVTQWLDVMFDHARDADFALNGAHADLTCASCHVQPVAIARPATECFGCHVEDDPHSRQLGESCSVCHGDVAWKASVRFDHDLTRFPLLGKHDEAVCGDCHATQAFHDVEEQCVDCHLPDDVHEQRLGDDCGLCHNPNGWLLWTFDHNRQTAFALTGIHENLDCHGCHRQSAADGVIRLSSTCASCHRSDDVHNGEFGSNCAQCHTTESFSDSQVLQ